MNPAEDWRRAETVMPAGYTPPVVHDQVTCWRCGGVLADDPVSTVHAVLHLRGQVYAVHDRDTVSCVPTLHSPRMPMPRETP